MTTAEYQLFETPLGRCGIAWSDEGIVAVQLPGRSDELTIARLLERAPDARPRGGRAHPDVTALQAMLRGEPRTLQELKLDLRGVPEFHRRAYVAVRQVAPGETISYGELARRLGSPGAARAVGQAMAKNPFVLVVPCHRVMAAKQGFGGFSAEGGLTTKLRLLEREAGKRELTAEPKPFDWDFAAAAGALAASHRKLARLIERVGPLQLEREPTHSLFEALVRSIVHQQLSTKVARVIHQRVRELAGAELTAERLERISDAALRQAGLSQSKLLSLRDLQRQQQAGRLPSLSQALLLSDEALVERLTEVRGIGRWTVQMLLLFLLGRPDVWPVDDLGVRKGYALCFGERELPTPSALQARGRRWSPYRSALSWYLWRATELDWPARRGLKAPAS